MSNLFKDLKIIAAGAAIANASNTNSLGNAIDMQGFDGCLFVVPIEDCANTGVATASVEQCDTSGGSYAALSGASAAKASAADDDMNQKYLVVDVHKPRKQYLKLRRASATANVAYGSAIAILYNARSKPTDVGAALTRTGVVSPAEA